MHGSRFASSPDKLRSVGFFAVCSTRAASALFPWDAIVVRAGQRCIHPSIHPHLGVEVMKAQGPAVRCSADGLLGRTSARWLAKRSNSPAP